MENELLNRRKKARLVFRKVGGVVILAILLITLAFSACNSSKHVQPTKMHYADAHAEGMKFIDNLKANNIHTIIGYYAGCHDCQPYSNIPYYVFWSSKDSWFATKFARTTKYNIIEGYAPPINYVQAFLDTLQNEKMVTLKVIKSSYHYEKVTIIVEGVEFDYMIKYHERQNNINTHRVVLTDSIRSVLSSIPETEWKALDY